MDLEKLKRIINAGDAKEVLEYFRDLAPDEISELAPEERAEALKQAGLLRTRKIAGGELPDYFYNSGYKAAEELLKSYRVKNSKISLFYFDCFLQINEREDLRYAGALVYKGSSLGILAEQGENTRRNLQESIDCFDKAAEIYLRENSELCYAHTLMNKGNTLQILAEQGEDTGQNLQKSIDCFDKAAEIYLRENSELSYAHTLMNKGISLQTLAEQGEDTWQNLQKSIDCFEKAAKIYLRENSELSYAHTLTNKGNSLQKLVEGENTLPNLQESIDCFDEAAKIYLREDTELSYANTLTNKGNSLQILAEQKIDSENNYNEAVKCYSEAEDIYCLEKCFLPFISVSLNHCLALWWRFTETKDQGDREEAIKVIESAESIGEKAFNEGEDRDIVSPLKKRLNKLLNEISSALKHEKEALNKESFERLKKETLEVQQRILIKVCGIDEKVDKLQESLDRLETRIDGFISDLEENGVRLSREDKIELRGWADALKEADDAHYKAFTEALNSLPENNPEKDGILGKADEKDKPVLKKFWEKFCNINKEISKEVGKSVAADSVKESIPAIIPHIQAIMGLAAGFSMTNPALVAAVILPFLIAYFKKLKN